MRFNRFIYLFLTFLLWLLATKSTKYIRKKKNKNKKTIGNFNRGECLGSPYTGYGPVCMVSLFAKKSLDAFNKGAVTSPEKQSTSTH